MENPRDAINPSLSSPVHVHIDQDTPLYVHIVRKNLKQKERNQIFESYKLKEEQDGEKVMKRDSIKDSNHRLPICGLTRLPETSENAIHLLSNIFSPFQNKSELEQTQLIVKQQQNEFAKLRSLHSQQEDQLKLFQQELNLLEKQSMAVQSSLILLQSQSEIFSETENKLPEPQDLSAKVADVEKQMKSSVATTAELEKSMKSWIPECGMKEDSWWKKWMLSQHEQHQDLLRKLLDSLQSMKIGERSQSKKEELNINFQNLKTQLDEKQELLQDMKNELRKVKSKVETLECQKQALENVKRHLQGELRSKESELERLKVHLKWENHASLEEQKKNKFLSEEVQKKTAAEKEALKKAVKVQRQRADSNEELVKKMTHLAQEKECVLLALTQERDRWKSDLTEVNNQKLEAETQLNSYKKHVMELETIINKIDTSYQDQVKSAESGLQERNAKLVQLEVKNKSLQIEKEILNKKFRTLEKKLELSDMNLQKIEILTKDLQQTKHHVKHSGKQDYNQETQLENTNRILIDQKQLIEDLKKEHRQKEASVEKFMSQLEAKDETIKKLGEQLQEVQTETQEKIHKLQTQLSVQEEVSQVRMSALQETLKTMKLRANKLLSEKEEMQKDLQKKIEEIQEQLEYSLSTNRSLQNYVTFLKNSYAAVFADHYVSTDRADSSQLYTSTYVWAEESLGEISISCHEVKQTDLMGCTADRGQTTSYSFYNFLSKKLIKHELRLA
ncbi:uncharacterized protein LOC143224073 isoform X3 [Tachypleus tridentatus]|uniref:uncharacterized protein LOC143224073 isoform X3 n=1 Tax=Tachypleus tridentatus TaxID=6853 RepID=UPI003FD5CDF8